MTMRLMMLGCLLGTVFMPGSVRGFSQTPEGSGPFGAPEEAEKTIIGCILQRNDRFFVVNKKRPEGLEIRMAADLKRASGLQAKIKGLFEYAPQSPTSVQSTTLRSETPKPVPVAMEVSSMTYMSGTCDENGMIRK